MTAPADVSGHSWHVLDEHCPATNQFGDRLHEIVLRDDRYWCDACDWPAQYLWSTNRWVVERPFLIEEEPTSW